MQGGKQKLFSMCRKVRAMWENETIVLVTSLKKRILAGNTKVRFGKFSQDEAIPKFVRHYFQQNVIQLLQEEQPIVFKSTPHFNLENESFASMKGQFQGALQDSALLSTEEIESFLQEILVLRLDYLVKPIDTMRHILFEKKQQIVLDHIETLLNPFINILPYAENLIGSLKDSGQSTLVRENYGEKTSLMLNEIFQEDPVKTVSNEFSQLTQFLSETKGEEIKRVDSALLHDFFSDRNLWGFRRALEVETKLGREDFDLLDLEMMLKRYIELKEDFKQENTPVTQPKVISGVPEKEEVNKSEAKIEAKTEENKEDVSDWDLDDVLNQETFSMDIKPEPLEEARPESPKQKNMRIIRHEKEEAEEKARTEIKVSDDLTKEPEKLENLIDNKTQKIFVKKLFSGDQSAYSELTEKLDEAESWRVAKILIDNELFKRDVDPFSREAIKLVDMVYSRYYPEEGVGGIK